MQNAKRSRVPSYADVDAIRRKYRVAQILTKITGVKYQTDHRHPLFGANESISGLHHEDNLRVITGKANRQKSNKFTPHFIKITCPFISYGPYERIYQLP